MDLNNEIHERIAAYYVGRTRETIEAPAVPGWENCDHRTNAEPARTQETRDPPGPRGGGAAPVRGEGLRPDDGRGHRRGRGCGRPYVLPVLFVQTGRTLRRGRHRPDHPATH